LLGLAVDFELTVGQRDHRKLLLARQFGQRTALVHIAHQGDDFFGQQVTIVRVQFFIEQQPAVDKLARGKRLAG